jgi:hypothetical protein
MITLTFDMSIIDHQYVEDQGTSTVSETWLNVSALLREEPIASEAKTSIGSKRWRQQAYGSIIVGGSARSGTIKNGAVFYGKFVT